MKQPNPSLDLPAKMPTRLISRLATACALTYCSTACHAAESFTPEAWGGEIAQGNTIFLANRGELIANDTKQAATQDETQATVLAAIYDPLELNPLALPVKVANKVPDSPPPPSPPAKNQPDFSVKPAEKQSARDIDFPPPVAAAPPEKHDAPPPLARGELGDPKAHAITDNMPLNLALSLGTILVSASLDHAGDKFAIQHGSNGVAKSVSDIGNALPFIAIGFAGLAALDSSDPRLSRTGFAALQAGGASALSSFGLKYLFARARPEANLGASQFHNAATTSGDSSLPSIHTATVWGIITPFAKEYDQPWLYGVATLTNYARVADRKHWVSDTVAGSLIGYWLGEIAWQRGKPKADNSAQVFVSDKNITLSWPF